MCSLLMGGLVDCIFSVLGWCLPRMFDWCWSKRNREIEKAHKVSGLFHDIMDKFKCDRVAYYQINLKEGTVDMKYEVVSNPAMMILPSQQGMELAYYREKIDKALRHPSKVTEFDSTIEGTDKYSLVYEANNIFSVYDILVNNTKREVDGWLSVEYFTPHKLSPELLSLLDMKRQQLETILK